MAKSIPHDGVARRNLIILIFDESIGDLCEEHVRSYVAYIHTLFGLGDNSIDA